jgi:hypothetical protein
MDGFIDDVTCRYHSLRLHARQALSLFSALFLSLFSALPLARRVATGEGGGHGPAQK